jgi:hypothetical protein
VAAQACGSVTRELAWDVRRRLMRGNLGHVCGPPLAPVPWPDCRCHGAGDFDRRSGHAPTPAAPRNGGSGGATHRRHACVGSIPCGHAAPALPTRGPGALTCPALPLSARARRRPGGPRRRPCNTAARATHARLATNRGSRSVPSRPHPPWRQEPRRPGARVPRRGRCFRPPPRREDHPPPGGLGHKRRGHRPAIVIQRVAVHPAGAVPGGGLDDPQQRDRPEKIENSKNRDLDGLFRHD